MITTVVVLKQDSETIEIFFPDVILFYPILFSSHLLKKRQTSFTPHYSPSHFSHFSPSRPTQHYSAAFASCSATIWSKASALAALNLAFCIQSSVP